MSASSRHDQFLAQLPADWERVPLSEIGQLIGGGTPSRTNPVFWNGEIPWVTPSEISSLGTKWLRETRERITEAGLRGSAARLLPAHTILITTRATVGAVALASLPVATNQGFHSVICNETADPDFYYHLMQRIAPELRRLASGSTFDEISAKDLSRVVVPRPDLHEQRAIATALDLADDQVNAGRKTLTKVSRLRAGIVADMLCRGLDSTGQLRPAPEGGGIPDGWQTTAIADLGEVVTGSTPPSGVAGLWGDAMPFVTPGDVQGEGRLRQERVTRWLSTTGARTVRPLPANAVLTVCIGATLGKVTTTSFTCATNQQINALVPEELHDLDFLGIALTAAKGKLDQVAGLQALPLVNKTQFGRIRIAIPPPDEQQRIGEVVRAIDALLRVEADALQKLEHLKSGLSHDLLTGNRRGGTTAAAA